MDYRCTCKDNRGGFAITAKPHNLGRMNPLPGLLPSRCACYAGVLERLRHLFAGESDPIALMATAACELHHAFPHFHWTGFYRVVEPGLLKVGPYQGGHGCLRIPFDKGVCGAVARNGRLLRLDDVHSFPDHIACASSTRSEIVVPVFANGELLAVLDVDSDDAAAFTEEDESGLTEVARLLGEAVTAGT